MKGVAHITTTNEQVYVDAHGVEVESSSAGSIELRCVAPGWRWHDQEGRIWGSAGAPVAGELKPRWVRR